MIGRLAAESKIAFNPPRDASALAPVPAGPELAPLSLWERFGFSLLALVAGLLLPGIAWPEALTAMLAAALLIGFAERLQELVPALGLGAVDRAAIALGTLAAGVYGGTALHVAALAAAAHLAVVAERQDGSGATNEWLLVGILAAAPVFVSGPVALLAPILMALMLAGMAVVMPYRMRRTAGLWLAAGASIVAGLGVMLQGGLPSMPSSPVALLLPLALISLVGLQMLGRQYLLSPLIMLVAWTAMLAAAAFANGGRGLLALTGLLLVCAVRLAVLLAGTARPRLIGSASRGAQGAGL